MLAAQFSRRIAGCCPAGVPVLAGLLLLLAAGCRRSETGADKAAPAGKVPPPAPVFAVLETDKGTIEIELLPGDAPKTVENFRLLAERGYYDGLTFHRIVKGFMIQGSDPQGDGRGGESAWGGKFDDEIKRESPLYERGLGYKRGVVAMANAGPNTNGSQFFILHKDHPMAPNYTIFGRVASGMEVVDVLAELPTQRGADGGRGEGGQLGSDCTGQKAIRIGRSGVPPPEPHCVQPACRRDLPLIARAGVGLEIVFPHDLSGAVLHTETSQCRGPADRGDAGAGDGEGLSAFVVRGNQLNAVAVGRDHLLVVFGLPHRTGRNDRRVALGPRHRADRRIGVGLGEDRADVFQRNVARSVAASLG
jgi:cyclophilin family peptidyl-prolyl cis-trans isomerase